MNVHGRAMKSSKTNFVTTTQNKAKNGARDMKHHNVAMMSAKRTQQGRMTKMVEEKMRVQKESITELVTPQVTSLFESE